ncbi:MAG: histidinol-phosphatase [Hyphomicrobiales bacterium]|nr:histidinol-phosphatase [Hyphomicrobiales bacterium]MDE2115717.1 histidinol-phosphatase [Hyphomicrobiales bacterium]
MTAVDFEGFVDRLAQASGETILPFFRTRLGVEDKAAGHATRKFDPVTEADRAAETVMRHMIRTTFPQHGIIGEEFGSHAPDAEYVWVLDPIDGTRGFIAGVPMWGTLIGLLHKGVPSYGVMNQPFTRERFRGDGQSAYAVHDGGPARKLATRACEELAQATLMTTMPQLFKGRKHTLYQSVEKQARLTRYCADCYAFCMVATGHVDIVIETNLKPYDIVALVPIIEGAGGVVTNWQGESPAKGGDIIACGDRALHQKVLEMLAG